MAVFSLGKTRFTANTITIRGKTVHVDGRDVTDIVIDGDLAGGVSTSATLDLIVHEGVVENIITDGSVSAKDVTGCVSAGGSVNCGRVGKDITAGGSVNCDCVGGNIGAGGSVNCGRVQGNITAKGSVRHA